MFDLPLPNPAPENPGSIFFLLIITLQVSVDLVSLLLAKIPEQSKGSLPNFIEEGW